MRTRTALAAGAALLVAGGSLSPALAGSTGGVIKGTWTASATPDPTGDTPAGSAKCQPVTPSGRATKELVIPGPGTLEVALNNQLDWSGDIRTKADNEVQSDSDGSTPTDAESMSASFKKKTTVIIGACNLEGEPSINVTYVFTPKKKK